MRKTQVKTKNEQGEITTRYKNKGYIANAKVRLTTGEQYDLHGVRRRKRSQAKHEARQRIAAFRQAAA